MNNNQHNIIEMRHIVKSFAGFKANNDMNLSLKKGEILALLGENGAGKSTLMNILSGLLKPTTGEIYLHNKKTIIKDPNHAKELGIGMVHQHFMLENSFTVLENIILGNEITTGPILNFKKAKTQIMALAKHYGLLINPDAKVADITVAQQQRVEILKVLYRGADILIFDEPTAVLAPQEITEFIQILKSLAKEGKAIILITHKLEEIKAVADRVTVIRNGHDVGNFLVKDITNETLAELMIGHPIQMKLPKPAIKKGPVILQVKNLKVKTKNNNLAINKLSFTIHGGEILGIAGIDGNGQDELVTALTGLQHSSAGEILIKDKNIVNKSSREINKLGVATIPADRQKYGLILPMSLSENLILKNYYHLPYSKHKLLKFAQINEHAKKAIKAFDIRTSSINLPTGELSGGNQQKVILARELTQNADLIIAFQPTRGLDIGAIEHIHKQLLTQKAAGKAILLISYELSEIMSLSDRILVLHNGQAAGVVNPETTTETELGLLMTGVNKVEAHQ